VQQRVYSYLMGVARYSGMEYKMMVLLSAVGMVGDAIY
jgi:hypothetical protein